MSGAHRREAWPTIDEMVSLRKPSSQRIVPPPLALCTVPVRHFSGPRVSDFIGITIGYISPVEFEKKVGLA